MAALDGHLPALRPHPHCQGGRGTRGARPHRPLPAEDGRGGLCVSPRPASGAGGLGLLWVTSSHPRAVQPRRPHVGAGVSEGWGGPHSLSVGQEEAGPGRGETWEAGVSRGRHAWDRRVLRSKEPGQDAGAHGRTRVELGLALSGQGRHCPRAEPGPDVRPQPGAPAPWTSPGQTAALLNREEALTLAPGGPATPGSP